MVVLDEQHWTIKNWKQRMHARDWADIMLKHEDKIFYCGDLITLRAKSLGYGVVEVCKYFRDPHKYDRDPNWK